MGMGNLPKLVTIGPNEYVVELVKEFAECEDLQGSYSATEQTIKLKEGNHARYMESTLVHEIIHALLYAAGMNNDERNEEIAARLEVPLYQFLLDNTDYFKPTDDVRVIEPEKPEPRFAQKGYCSLCKTDKENVWLFPSDKPHGRVICHECSEMFFEITGR